MQRPGCQMRLMMGLMGWGINIEILIAEKQNGLVVEILVKVETSSNAPRENQTLGSLHGGIQSPGLISGWNL